LPVYTSQQNSNFSQLELLSENLQSTLNLFGRGFSFWQKLKLQYIYSSYQIAVASTNLLFDFKESLWQIDICKQIKISSIFFGLNNNSSNGTFINVKKRLQVRAMKQIVFLSCILLLIIPCFAYGAQPAPEPVVILFNDSTGTIDLNDIETQPQPNRILYHMMNVVLPKEYGINIKFKPILWTRGLELIKTGLADGITDASYNDERAAYAVYPMKAGKPDPDKMLRLIEYSLYKNKNSTITWDGTRFDDIGRTGIEFERRACPIFHKTRHHQYLIGLKGCDKKDFFSVFTLPVNIVLM